MKKTFTQEEFYNRGGCWIKEKNEDLKKLMIELSDSNGNISFESLLLSPLPSLKDKAWCITHSLNLSVIEMKYILLESAKSVVNIYNKKYSNDKRISLCINITARYLKGLVSLDVLNKYRDAAYSAAYATTNAAADAAAAYTVATADTTYAAAYAAANAAYSAAVATAYATYDAAYAAASAAYTAAYATADATAAAYAADAADAVYAVYASDSKQSDKLIKSWIKILKTFKDDNI